MRIAPAVLILACATLGCRKEQKPPPPPKPVVAPVETFDERYGHIWVDIVHRAIQTGDGGFLLAGKSEKVDDAHKGDYDGYVVRVNPAGERDWSWHVGELDADDDAWDVAEVDGGFIVAGVVSDPAQDKQAWVVRLDAAGKTVWDKRIGGAGKDEARAVAVTGRGGIFVVGSTTGGQKAGPDDKRDLAVHALDLSGKVLWSRTHGTDANDRGNGILVLDDGTVITCGYTYSVGAGDGWLLALDPAGEKLWEKTYGGAGDDWFDDCKAIPGGGYALAGATTPAAEDKRNGWLVVTDAAGATLHDKSYGSSATDSFDGVAVRPGGGFALAGTTRKSGLGEAWVVLAGPDGTPEKEPTFPVGRRAAMDVLYTTDGALVVAGDWGSLESNYGNFWLWKGKP